MNHMFAGNYNLPVAGGGGTAANCSGGDTCCTAGITMPGPMSTKKNSSTLYKIQISERFPIYTFCTGMTVPMLLFCILHRSYNFGALH
jgi:hypothetical protein